MDGPERENRVKCSMCFATILDCDFVRHVVRCHSFDPQFQVQCKHDGCGSTFSKWATYRQHIWRKRPNAQANINNIEQENFRDVADIEEEQDVPNFNEGYEQEREERREEIMTPMDRLQWYSAQFLVNIRENCKISQTALDNIISGVQRLLTVFSSIVVDDLHQQADPGSKLLHLDVVNETLTRKYPPSMLFSSVNSKYALDKVLVEKFGMVEPRKLVIYKELAWAKQPRSNTDAWDLVNVERCAYVVPFLENLKILLSNDEVRFNVDNPKAPEIDVYRSVLDGSYYRDNEYFRNNRNALAIILYYDDLGIANPLGVNSKSQKLSMFYWTLANIHPEVRSTQQTVQLLAIVKTEFLKKEGAFQKLLEPFIADIIRLQTEGIAVKVQGNDEIVYKGSLLFCAGDTPASALLGGFKESVSAYRPCRQCMTTKDDWRVNFLEDNFVLRDKMSHQEYIEVISEPNIPQNVAKFWKKRYGINNRSPLLDIPNFDVTTSLPQDAMHTLIEGVVHIACRALLRYCIEERRLFSIYQLNDRRIHFNYGHCQKDAPAVILHEHLAENSNLRQTASQMFVLAHTIPFLIGEWVVDTEDNDISERMMSHTHLLQIMNICFAYEIHVQAVDQLSRMIELYIPRFNRLYPGCIVPKFHFLIHIPRCIRLFGPARQQWCFRFEAAHAYFKSLVPVVRNFKNMPCTLSYRHQARLCSRLATCPGEPSKRFLYQGDKISPGTTVLLNNLANARLFYRHVPEADRPTCLILRTSKVVVHGTTYARKSIILWQCNDDSLPSFGKIEEIFILEDRILLVVSFLETLFYHDKLNAYCVTETCNNFQDILLIEDLIFPHPLLHLKLMNSHYVGLLNHERNEFFG